VRVLAAQEPVTKPVPIFEVQCGVDAGEELASALTLGADVRRSEASPEETRPVPIRADQCGDDALAIACVAGADTASAVETRPVPM
jgi:hypothetical protein